NSSLESHFGRDSQKAVSICPMLDFHGWGSMNSSQPAENPESAPAPSTGFVEEVEIVGHIVDSLLLPKVLDEIMLLGGRFDIHEVRVGHRRSALSYARLNVIADTPAVLEAILSSIGQHGAVPVQQQDGRLVSADMDGAF